jgi:hypothetical protein
LGFRQIPDFADRSRCGRRIGTQNSIAREHSVIDGRIHSFAELDNEGRLSRIEKARFG